jgi:hypothetical protein
MLDKRRFGVRTLVVIIATVLLLTTSPSCCKDAGEKFESDGRGHVGDTDGGGYIAHNRLLDYGYYRSKPGEFDEDIESGTVRVIWNGEARDFFVAKPGETIVPITIREDGFYYGKLEKESDAMKIIFRPFSGSDDILLAVGGLNDRLDTEYFEGATVSWNGRYLTMYFRSGTLIAADLQEGKEFGRYDTEGAAEDTPPYTFVITNDGKLIRIRNHIATVEYTARVYLTDLRTGVESDITPTGARTAGIGGDDEPVLAVEVKDYTTMPIRPFQDFEGGENWYGPTKILYYPDLGGKPVSAIKTRASSTLVEDSNDPGRFGPEKAFDGDPTTTWVEGAPGGGVGESLTVTFPATFSFDTVTIFGGYGASEAKYYGNARPKKITITTDAGTKVTAELPESNYETVYFKEPVIASEFVFEIESVYAGKRWDDCCISDVAFGFER